jgi:(p)ppGpp synthase/HD superfamily hydrolase
MKDYYRKIKDNRYTSIVKGADRLHNLMTMVGVFSNEKMQSYIDETKEYIIPILQVWDEEYVCMRELDLINSLIRNIEYFLCKDVSRINQTIVQKRNGIELVVEQKLV